MSKVHNTYFKTKISQAIRSRTNIATQVKKYIPNSPVDAWTGTRTAVQKTGMTNIISGFLTPKSTK